jgi:hypothetical protein
MEKPDPTEYSSQLTNNNAQMEAAFRQFFPDFPKFNTSFDYIFQTLMYLEEMDVNPEILPRVIRGVNNLQTGTGKGQVIIHVKGDKLMVETRESGEEMDTKR